MGGNEMNESNKPVAWIYDFLNPDNRDEVIRDWMTRDYNEIEREKGFNVRPLYTRPQPTDEPVGVVSTDTSKPHLYHGTQYLGQATDRKMVMLFKDLPLGTPVYTRPQPSTQCEYIQHTKEGTHWCALAEKPAAWVGLTDAEILHFQEIYDVADIEYERVIEAKLKEKNNG
jgi:hypothetical protein